MYNYGLLIDLDHVISQSGEAILTVVDLINSLVRAEIPFLLFTNNSQRTRLGTTLKVQKQGFNVTVDQIYMCEMSTDKFLSKLKANPTAFIMETDYLLNALNMNGIDCVGKNTKFTVVDDILPGCHSIMVFSRGAQLVENSSENLSLTQEESIHPILKFDDYRNILQLRETQALKTM